MAKRKYLEDCPDCRREKRATEKSDAATLAAFRDVLKKIAKRRPVVDAAGTAFYRSRTDAQIVLGQFPEVKG